MCYQTNYDGDAGNGDEGEETIVIEHISTVQILVSILILVVLYVLSKWLVSQQEPDIRVDGKFSFLLLFIISTFLKHLAFGKTRLHSILDYRESSQHHWQYSDLLLHPLYCNVCHNLLLVAKVLFITF